MMNPPTHFSVNGMKQFIKLMTLWMKMWIPKRKQLSVLSGSTNSTQTLFTESMRTD